VILKWFSAISTRITSINNGCHIESYDYDEITETGCGKPRYPVQSAIMTSTQLN